MRIDIYTISPFTHTSLFIFLLLHNKKYYIFTFILLLAACNISPTKISELKFNETNAIEHIENQVNLGPRIPGSNPHQKTQEYIEQQLNQSGWEVETQEVSMEDHKIANIIAKYGKGEPLVIFGAHYDTRLISDRDPILENISTPVPGANDGASGVAVLLELARILPESINNIGEFGSGNIKQVWLVFFDAEDNGNIPGWDWILGSRAFAETLNKTPDAVIILDMIGDANLKIYQEKNSDIDLSTEIWETAKILGYNESFIPLRKYRILDDHVPFLDKGIPSVDIIDFEYPHWHTTGDTIDKISPESLKIVGETVLTWLLNKQFSQN